MFRDVSLDTCFFCSCSHHASCTKDIHTPKKWPLHATLGKGNCLEPPRHMGSVLLHSPDGWNLQIWWNSHTYIERNIITNPLILEFLFFFPALCCMCLLSLKQTPVFLGCLLHTTYVSASVFVDRYFCGFKLGGADRNRSARDPSGFEDPLSFPRWFDDSMMIRHVRWNQGVTCGIFSHETRNVWGEYCVVSKTHRYTINILYFEVKNRHIMFTFKGQSFMSTHDCTWIQTPS